LADSDHDVMCIDVDRVKIEGLQVGIIPIYEPGLREIVIENCRSGRLNFTCNAKTAVRFGELQFITLGTPPNVDGSVDLGHVLTVARTIGDNMDSAKIIIENRPFLLALQAK